LEGRAARCNLLGPTALGFRHRDDITEVTRLLTQLGVEVNVVAPMGASTADLMRLPQADFNVVMYAETGATAAQWLTRQFKQAAVRTTPIGVHGTRAFIREVTELVQSLGGHVQPVDEAALRAPWYAKSVDSTYLTGKRVFIFGDATHAVAAARVAAHEMGFEVVGLGTYSREQAREVREAAAELGLQALITDDYLEVEETVAALQPELVLGTQMERHIAKRLGIPCAVISAPVHVQDFPARYAPQMGFEGANVLFDTWVHPLMMGLEEHLLHMFKDDFEFHQEAAPSHLGSVMRNQGADTPEPAVQAAATAPDGARAIAVAATDATHTPAAAVVGSPAMSWTPDGEQELKKIPFFVRGKAKRNTERYALDHGIALITVETLYDAKAHFSR
jgi:light-independent protochlorophyllide reductase subunit B